MSNEPHRLDLLRLGPPLRDYDAAITCQCHCHPRISSTHAGGQECQCQFTEEERKQRLQDFLASLREFDEADREAREAERVEFAAVADELGVKRAENPVSACPLVVAGIVHGRSFFLRERGGSYRVEIAPSSDPTVDLWRSDMEGVVIRRGDEGDIYCQPGPPAVAALRLAAESVADHLRQSLCAHQKAPGWAMFCPECGARLGVSLDPTTV